MYVQSQESIIVLGGVSSDQEVSKNPASAKIALLSTSFRVTPEGVTGRSPNPFTQFPIDCDSGVGEERADEDDGGEHGEGEDAERALGIAELAEDERGAVDGVAEQSGDDAGDFGEHDLAVAPLDDTEGKDYLEAETPRDGAPLDSAAVGGESVGEAEEGDESK